MGKFNLEQCVAYLHCVDKPKAERILLRYQIPAVEENIIPLQLTVLLTFDWLKHLHLFDDDQIHQILEVFSDQIGDFVISLIEKNNLKKTTLCITDQVFCSMSGCDKFLNVLDYSLKEKLTCPGITHIMCDIAVMYAKVASKLDSN